ncbi:hypothetical protein [uncultured Tenacibaculum sp.]|uniref:hypothetical protein n=1 Tax=uncultured Tenacibaculum sp. TaxID=174713 RepID=UPI002639EAFC|nr:hypothetical protein [uncultured Tenacibaculum sp.]
MPKTWLEKYNSTKPPVVKVIDKRFADLEEGTKMFIATPKIIDNYVNEIPKGTSVDIKVMRKDMAIEHFAENSCPVTTSIFLRIVAEVALESLTKGKTTNDITPFWRVVHPKTPLAKKLSCGVAFIKEQRSKENING